MNVHTPSLLCALPAPHGRVDRSVQPQSDRDVSACERTAAAQRHERVEFEVKKGKAREIVAPNGEDALESRFSVPIRNRAFQRGLGLFMQKLLGHAEFAPPQ